MENKTSNLMDSGGMIYPEAIWEIAGATDGLFYFILFISTIISIGLVAATIYFLRTGKSKNKETHITHSNAIELTWTIIPTILVMIVFYWGFVDYIKMRTPPSDAYEIRVTAKKWLWQFDYPGGTSTIGELIVPLNHPVKLVMSSEDVLHSFFLPNMRAKRDVLPNRYTTLWFQAEKTGKYQIFCTEYCGDAHSQMLATLEVKSLADFEEWVETGGGAAEDVPLDELGAKLYKSRGCNACHSVDGSQMIGPSWKGIFGAVREFVDGSSAKADDNYIRQSIVNPGDQILAGYQPVMPTYSGMLSDREINAIIEYIKTLK